MHGLIKRFQHAGLFSLNGIQTTMRLRMSFFEVKKPIIHAVETIVDAIETIVDAVETIVDAVEASMYLPETIRHKTSEHFSVSFLFYLFLFHTAIIRAPPGKHNIDIPL